MHPLIEAWREFDTTHAPFLLKGDEVLQEHPELLCPYDGWDGYIASPDVGKPNDSRIHVNLLPLPFAGNLESAKVFILMLNPGYGPSDYFGENRVPEYRTALINNLKQSPANNFMFFDPIHAWHGGYHYWHSRKFAGLIMEYANQVAIPYGESRARFQKEIAAIELFPYHSLTNSLPGNIREQLHSVKLVRSYVEEVLLPRAHAGECLIIVTRAVSTWELASHPNVILYTGGQARGASLTPHSSGGEAILRFLNLNKG